MISLLIWGYKYGGLKRGKGGWEILKVIKSLERERERESEPESKTGEWIRDTREIALLSLCAENDLE